MAYDWDNNKCIELDVGNLTAQGMIIYSAMEEARRNLYDYLVGCHSKYETPDSWKMDEYHFIIDNSEFLLFKAVDLRQEIYRSESCY